MKRLNNLRNIGIMAHVDAGKTTVTERILYYSGMIHRMGNVDDGNTVMDRDPQESKRGITISSAAITTNWSYENLVGQKEDYTINIIDTPGHVDFVIEVERSLRVLDGAIAVFCAASGVEPQSENVWYMASKHEVPRICFVNKMDRQGADFMKVVNEIRERLEAVAIPLQIPIGSADDFIGVIDLLEMKALIWEDGSGQVWTESEIPDEYREEAVMRREEMLELIAQEDDDFMLHYLDTSKNLDTQSVLDALKRATIRGVIFPVLCGTAYKDKGVQPLIDAVVRYLPAPADLADLSVLNAKTEEEELLKRDVDEQFTALAFKVIVDKHMGKLSLIRLYSGQLRSGMMVFNSRTQEKVRISRILEIRSNDYKNLDQAIAGEICALVGLKDVRMGDTLCAIDRAFVLESIEVPDPVISLSVEAKTQQDQKLMGPALAHLTEEDPSLRVIIDGQTGQTLLKGMGELHLEVSLEKIRLSHELELNKGAPRVAYKETVTTTVKHRERFIKQSGGSGQFADITFTMGPRDDDAIGLELLDQTKGGAIPKEYIPSIEKGFQTAIKNGLLGGYPIDGLKVVLLDGEIHREDSHAADFETVAKNGFKSIYASTSPKLLEPVMRVEIAGPEEFTGSISSDVNKRRGMVVSLEDRGNRKVVQAEVPLAKTFGYISDLRNLSSGRATIMMQFAHYAVVPDNLAKQILEIA